MYEDLLNLARESINSELNQKEFKASEILKKKYNDKKACFVTITLNGKLRGCIGSLKASRALWKDVVDNALMAAFNDPRFSSLTKKESEKIKIEISILTTPKILGKGSEVYHKINNEMGIILKKGFNSATFLPQVWEQIPNKIEFLEELSRKAGLNFDEWKEATLEFYKVEKVKEN